MITALSWRFSNTAESIGRFLFWFVKVDPFHLQLLLFSGNNSNHLQLLFKHFRHNRVCKRHPSLRARWARRDHATDQPQRRPNYLRLPQQQRSAFSLPRLPLKLSSDKHGDLSGDWDLHGWAGARQGHLNPPGSLHAIGQLVLHAWRLQPNTAVCRLCPAALLNPWHLVVFLCEAEINQNFSSFYCKKKQNKQLSDKMND